MALQFYVSVQAALAAIPDAPTQRTRIPTLVGPHDVFAERARLYATLDEMLEDGFTDTDDLYLMASAMLDNPSANDGPVARWFVGRTTTATANTRTINIVGTANGVMNLVDSHTGEDVVIATFTANSSTAEQIKTGLLASLDTLYTGASVDTDTFTVAPDELGVTMVLSVTGAAAANVQLSTNTAANGIDDDLDAIVAETVNDYSVGSQTHTIFVQPGLLGRGGIIMAQNWVHAQASSSTGRGYLLFAQSSDGDLIDSGVTDNAASLLIGLGKSRLVLAYRAADADPICARAGGHVVPSEPGSVGWPWRTLTGSSAPSGVTLSINQLIYARRLSHAERYKELGEVIFHGGLDATGAPAHHYAAMDAWRDDMVRVIAEAMQNSTGIDMTDTAFTVNFAAPIRTAMLGMVGAGRLAEGYTVTFTPMADIPPAERRVGDFYTTGRITVTATLRVFAERIAMSGTFGI